MKDYTKYERADIIDKGFPLKIFHSSFDGTGLAFYNHWHEQLEILYFLEGKGIVECDSKSIEVNAGDLIIINSNELHGCYYENSSLTYDCILLDSSFLKGNYDGNCEQKYITPMVQNKIMFKNKITRDAEMVNCVEAILMENQQRQAGYELFIKSLVYRLFGILYRNYVEKILTEKEYFARMKSLERLNKVISYIDKNYMNYISVEQLAQMMSLSRYHFCHLFKKLMGRGVNEYINMLRIDQAERLIKNTDMTITEISMSTGFNDSNYFSRIFSKYKKISPSTIRKNPIRS